MRLSDLIGATIREAVRPNHVAARVQGQRPPDVDQVNGFANLIEGEIDKVLHNPKPNKDVQIWHLVVNVQIGLEWSICRIPLDMVGHVQQIIIQRYSRAGWTMQIGLKSTEMIHPYTGSATNTAE